MHKIVNFTNNSPKQFCFSVMGILLTESTRIYRPARKYVISVNIKGI